MLEYHGPQSGVTIVLMRKGEGTQTHRQYDSVKMERCREKTMRCTGETGGMLPQAKGCQGEPVTLGKWEEARKIPHGVSEEPISLTPWSLTSGFQDCGKTHFCYFEPPSLHDFETATLGNEYRKHPGDWCVK